MDIIKQLKNPPKEPLPQISLVRAATFALAAYRWSEPDPKQLCTDKVTSFQDRLTGTEGFVGSDGDMTIVAFAGTDQRNDWMTNIQCKMTEIELPGGYYIQVHKGFYQAYLSVGEKVQQLIELHSNGKAKKLIFTGHSLGGALATIAALKCRVLDRPHKVITFGGPRVGSLALSSYMRRNVVRVVAGGDPVPHIPWPWVPWRPSTVYFHAGKVIRRGWYTPWMPRAHSMLRYLELAKEIQEELEMLL